MTKILYIITYHFEGSDRFDYVAADNKDQAKYRFRKKYPNVLKFDATVFGVVII